MSCPLRPLSPLRRLRSPRTCVLWFGAVLCALLLAQPIIGPRARANGVTDPARRPVVVQAATPSGWLPVTYGNAQISVPRSWSLVTGGAAACGPSTGVIVLGDGAWCPPGMGDSPTPGTSIATLTIMTAHPMVDKGSRAVVNGVPLYTPGVAPVYVVPSLGAELAFTGTLRPRVLHTLTASPRAVVLAPGPSPTPRSWRSISFDGLRFAVPPTWTMNRRAHAPPCATDIVLPEPGVTLARGPALPVPCPLPVAEVRPVPQVAGIEVDGFTASTPLHATCVGPRTIGHLHICLNAMPAYGVLVAQVSAPGMAPIRVKIGLTAGGTVGRSVLYSMRRS